MSYWRAKRMPLEDWAAFQDKYADLFTSLGGDGRMALFIQGNVADDMDTLLIPAFNSEIVEALSPGGWAEHPHPEGADISLLVGNADAAEAMSVVLGIANE
jgi:hypothetical protein